MKGDLKAVDAKTGGLRRASGLRGPDQGQLHAVPGGVILAYRSMWKDDFKLVHAKSLRVALSEKLGFSLPSSLFSISADGARIVTADSSRTRIRMLRIERGR